MKYIRINLTQWDLKRCGLVVATVMTGLIWNDPVFAHGFAYRYDLPLPLHLYLIAAGAAVCLSFVVMAYTFHRKSALHSYKISLTRFIPGEKISQGVRILVSGFSVTLFVLIIAAGLFGHQSVLKNPAPVMVWVIWWVGFVYLTALVANIWPFLNPWSSIFQALEELSGFSFGKINYPPRLGVWPAFVLFMVFSWIELVWSGSERPRQLALTILAYSVLCWIGMAIYGRQTWLKRGEVFSIVFSIFARFSPLEVRKSHKGPYLRPYGSGLLSRQASSFSLTTLVLAILAIVTFDGFMETPIWLEIKIGIVSITYLTPLLTIAQNAFGNLESILETIGLVIAPIAFLFVYFITCGTISWLDSAHEGPERPPLTTNMAARQFVLTLVPIAIAYHLAHYLSYFLIAGQLFIPLMSDPFDLGWDLFNTANHRINIGIINAKTVWHISIGVIVVGHMVAVYLAHVTALRVFVDRRRALVSQLPMIALMVSYTSFSLWILAQPIVES